MSVSLRGTKEERTRRLTDISRALTYARSLDEVLDLTMDCATDIFDTPRAVLMLTGEDGLLSVRASRGIDPASVERFREPLDENLLSRLTGLFGPDSRDTFLGVPLVVEGGVTGLLGILRDHDPAQEDEQEWLLSALADQAAIAVESTRDRAMRGMLEDRVSDLEKEQKGKDQALEILSHDLRSPLNAIQGYAALLSSEILGDVNDRQQDALRKIRRISDHLASMLGNVLEMARLTSGRLDLDSRDVQLDEVVTEAIDIVRPAAESAGITLEALEGDSPRVHTDPNRVRQVLVQLIENAVKYSPDDSRVVVQRSRATEAGRNWAEIAVIDEGPGIPVERHGQIFEPYVRHDGAAARGHAGVGLGLAISSNVIQHLGGTLTVESEMGAGSTFRIRLPAD